MKNRIRQLREESHMTQLRLSIELEVSQETVSAYEREKHYPCFQQLVKMSTLFHASIDYIMGLSPVRVPAEKAENEELLILTSMGKRLDKKQLALAQAYIQGLIDMKKEYLSN